MFRYKGNKKGNAILQVLTAMAVMSISFYFLSTYVIAQRKQIVKTKNVVNLKFAVHSALDYVVFGVRQKYCFDDNTLLQNTTSCDWLNKGNVERLVMTDEQLQSLQAMVEAGTNIGPHDTDLTKLRVDEISLTLKFPVSTNHPLFPVVNNLKKVSNEFTGEEIKTQGLKIKLNRPENAGYLPKAGREVYVVATVSLIDLNGKVIEIGREPLVVKSRMVVYPREMGSFALVLPGDLHMDKDWASGQAKIGDVNFHKFNNITDIGKAQGMVFKSPVFVNGNIFLPQDTGSAATSNYSATTFADRVYMGNGWILNPNNSPYTPLTQGALPDRFWSDSRVFGGFLRGIENDGLRDLGLDVLSGASTGSNGEDYKWNEICANLNLKSAEIESMEASNVKASLTDSSDSNGYYSKFRVNLTNYNTFYAQKNQLPDPVTTSSKGANWVKDTNWTVDNKGKVTGAISNVQFSYGDGTENKTFTVDLTKDGNFTLKPPVLNTARRSDYINNSAAASVEITKLQKNVTANTNSLASLKSKLQAAKTKLSNLQAQLATEQAREKEPEVVATPSPTATATATASPTATATVSPTATATATATVSPTATASASPTATATATVTPTVTPPAGGWYDAELVADLIKQVAAAQLDVDTYQGQIDTMEQSTIPGVAAEIAVQQGIIDSNNTALANYDKVAAAPPEILVDFDKSYSWSGKEYKDRIDVEVTVKNFQNLIDSTGKQVSKFSVRLKMYDGTYYYSQPIKGDKADPKHLLGYFNFTVDANGYIHRPTSLSANANASDSVDDESADLAAKCEEYYNMINSQSFGAANWGVSFSSNTRKSWNFAGVDKNITTDPILAEKKWSENDSKFYVFSIVGKCIIPKEVTFVAGFYTCDSLEIQDRTTALRIIGTFIIGKSMKVHPNAIKAGVMWSSIYWPQSTPELRAKKILAPYTDPDNAAKCDQLPSPIWHPMPSIQETADRMACNVISLRAKADPFKWTAVDPDCGISPGATQTVPTCKRRIYHYFVVEQSREGAGI